MTKDDTMKKLQERFGDPIGSYAGDAPVGVRGIDEDVCPACGMMFVQDACGCMSEGSSEPCAECGMMEVGGACGCTHEGPVEESDIGEVAPPGYEKVVKALKKEPGVENPWAVAWSMKKKGVEPKK